VSIKKELASLPFDKKALRNFGLLVGAVLAAIGLFFFWRRSAEWGLYLAAAGGLLILVGLVVPRILRPLYFAWMAVGLTLGTIVTTVLLTVFFLLVITPVGLFFRLIGRDALHRKFDRQAASYWIPKEYPIADRSRYEKFF
jgi:hypothetical protein